MTTPIALMGIGKIARDQHIPAIAASPDFELTAAISRNASVEGVAGFRDLDAFLSQSGGRGALSICTPPEMRPAMTVAALRAGHDVMIEKPPAASLGDIVAMEEAARESGRVLFATWHSRRAPAVETARAWLAQRRIDAIEITWHESVRQWHPGQDWVFEPGGFGVFDPGINALSILTHIAPGPHIVEAAEMEVPEGRQTPVRAELTMRCGAVPTAMSLDWLAEGDPLWRIEARTDAGTLRLDDGGARLAIDGAEQDVQGLGEYPGLYADFARLIAERRSDVDARPLRIVADALLRGRTRIGAPFGW